MAPQARTDDPTAKPHAAIATALVLLPLGTPATPAVAANRPTVQPLPAHLEAIRAAEATTLYGAPASSPWSNAAAHSSPW